MLTGDEWTAERACQWGLIQELVEPGEQLNKAMEIAEKIAKAAPLGGQGILKSSWLAISEGQEVARERLFPELRPVMACEEVQEGIQSFLERREAVFNGK
ncbi:enoyl-CoA hydratase-related protein [Marinobacter daepoensis]|uniref:enoyl-CoA hydratase-related protein n=1 Tax=Marinobacter daepoensis TaxID=262077 RepID=UPI0023F73F98|nr:enoyl-CoA hydratase-related protein [Marinobacter daepoensis]